MLREAPLNKQSNESEAKKLNEKKGAVGLWQCRECVLSALLLKAEPARAVIGKQKKFKASVKIGRSTPTS